MTYERQTYRITATKKRTGEVIEGITRWDGLASLLSVERADGTTAYVSCLDSWDVFEKVEDEA